MRVISEKNLFPVIHLPSFIPQKKELSKKYKWSVFWDMEAGDFMRSGENSLVQSDGKETYMQWCHKMISTERFAYLAYPNSIGVEMNYALGQPDHDATESCMELTITEALLVHPFTEYVRDFLFKWEGDTVICECMVKAKNWEEFKLHVNCNGKDT